MGLVEARVELQGVEPQGPSLVFVLAFVIPEDPEVTRADVEGRSVFTLSSGSAALGSVRQFVDKEILDGG